jgi:putative flavoprotein involved in K+ transport
MLYDFVVVGAGQAGLSMAYQLKKAGFSFLVIDGDQTIGGSWLKRWDSLSLFTPSQYNNLPGMDFPMKEGVYPDKNEVARYLQEYVDTFDLPVKLNCKAQKVTREGEIYQIHTDAGLFTADNLIVATGPFHTPFRPPCHTDISSDVIQLHANEYKNPAQLQSGDTLVVGAGDSGVQILSEIADTGKQVYFSGNTNSATLPQSFLGKTLWWWLSKLGILSASKYSWLGKKLSSSVQPIIGTNLKKILAKNNVEAVGRTLGVDGAHILFSEAQIASIKNIVWATGFRPDFSWIDNIPLDEKGYPQNYRGIGKQEGLFFIGLPWMHTRGSATLGGVKADAEFLIEQLKSKYPQRVKAATVGFKPVVVTS